MRPNFFANTPDILPEYLQKGGRPAFKMRLVLAATMSPIYGIYSGFELFENTPLHPGREEYLDSEKYEIKVRDWNAPGNIVDYVTRINEIRQRESGPAPLDEHALPRLRQRRRSSSTARSAPDGSNRLLVVANLDPFRAHSAWITLDGAALGTRRDRVAMSSTTC